MENIIEIKSKNYCSFKLLFNILNKLEISLILMICKKNQGISLYQENDIKINLESKIFDYFKCDYDLTVLLKTKDLYEYISKEKKLTIVIKKNLPCVYTYSNNIVGYVLENYKIPYISEYIFCYEVTVSGHDLHTIINSCLSNVNLTENTDIYITISCDNNYCEFINPNNNNKFVTNNIKNGNNYTESIYGKYSALKMKKVNKLLSIFENTKFYFIKDFPLLQMIKINKLGDLYIFYNPQSN